MSDLRVPVNEPRVYFMAAAGLIKIGWTSDIDARHSGINRASPIPVDYVASFPGERCDENALQRRFKHLRRRFEWFEDTPELRAEIERLCEFVSWPRQREDA